MENVLLGQETEQELEQGPVSAPAPGPVPGSDSLMAQYDKLRVAQHMLDVTQEGLDRLAALGDTVTTEDVVHEAGVLVAQGLDPIEMAGMLAEMPEKGEQIVEWLAGHVQDLAEREAQLQMVTRAVRQEIATGAMRKLMVQHAESEGDW